MIKVITYGTYDLLHYGHIRLLKRAKALGDYLIVGVTADSFDVARGKINVRQTLMERIEAVKATGLADEIVIEEYEGQKIDDIRRFGGAVKGDIDVHGPVIIDSSAIISGDIKSKSVQINNGATIDGRCSQCYADVNMESIFDIKGKKNK